MSGKDQAERIDCRYAHERDLTVTMTVKILDTADLNTYKGREQYETHFLFFLGGSVLVL
jgi:hypothetical protein